MQPTAPLSTECKELFKAISPRLVIMTGAAKTSMVDKAVDVRRDHSDLTVQALDGDLGASCVTLQ